MPRTRTLIFYPGLAPYRVDMFNALAERLDMCVVFLRENVAYQEYDQDRLRARCRFDFEYLTRGFDMGIHMVRFGLLGRIRAFRPDVVVAPEYGYTPQVLGLCRRVGIAGRWGLSLVTSDNRIMCEEETRLRSLLRRMALSNTDSLIVHTEGARDWFAEHGMRRERVAVAPNIQEETGFRARLAEALPVARELVERHGLAGRRIVLFIGRLVRVKGTDRLIEAFARVAAERDDATLAIVGEGSEGEALRALAAERGIANRTIFAGHREGADLLAWYALGGVFGLASHFEPYGAVINEALMAGMHVVCSSRAGAADLVGGAQGIVADPYDIEAIADSLSCLLDASETADVSARALRESRMPVAFSDAIDGFVSGVESARR